MYITRIKIKNFRSLADVEIYPLNYTALVGPNDSGKSNMLRALNLFFNEQTDVGQSLDFGHDYSQQPVATTKRAKQIEIEIEFQPPSNYTDNQPVVWRKVWRDAGLHEENFRVVGGGQFSPRSKTIYWLRQIGYEYVPAVRGREFFATLKRRLHNTLAETIAPRLAAASGSFLGNIRSEVGNIEREARRLFALTTEFSLPSDLGSLFEILDLETADSHATTRLQNRGDGIQGRHIPVILRFLAEQRKTNFARGKPPPETVWGYEEPENNLELVKQIDESNEFFRRSDSIQVLLTTHSPAFYSVTKAQKAANAWFATREAGRTSFARSLTTQALDEALGLMPFVEPYLAKAVARRQEMLAQIKALHAQSMHIDKAVLCVEGDTDKRILEAAWSALYDSPSPFEVVAKPGMGAGAGWLVGYATARAVLPDLNHKTAVLLDDDEAGRQARVKLKRRLEALERPGKIKCLTIGDKKTDAFRAVAGKGFKISAAMEELCGVDAWDHAEAKGWLELRTDAIEQNAGKLATTDSFEGLVRRTFRDAQIERLVLYRVVAHKKRAFSNYVAGVITNSGDVPEGLKALLESVRKVFETGAEGGGG